MEPRSPRFVTLCGGFLALTLVGVQLAGCVSNRKPAAGSPPRQSPATDEKSEPVATPATDEKSEPVASIPGFAFVKKNKQGYPEYTHEKTGIIFVKLPGGKFQMGSPEDEPNRFHNEGPVHEVTLSSFLIAKHEVTQTQWKRVMGTSPSHFKGDDLPVEKVSWNDCQEFCKKTGLSLPTEAQWEYACRAGTTTAYHSGDTEADLAQVAWFYLNSGHKDLPAGTEWERDKLKGWGCRTHPVGAEKPNDFGLHDMHGNVAEWCVDVYDAVYYSKAASRNGDKACTSGSGIRVTRGGSWSILAGRCRSAGRGGLRPVIRGISFGFRPLRPLR